MKYLDKKLKKKFVYYFQFGKISLKKLLDSKIIL